MTSKLLKLLHLLYYTYHYLPPWTPKMYNFEWNKRNKENLSAIVKQIYKHFVNQILLDVIYVENSNSEVENQIMQLLQWLQVQYNYA